MIWEFYKTERFHGLNFTGYDVVTNGYSRSFIFCNKPKRQRICRCKKCGVKIPREVPRIKLDASYYYYGGLYCLTCGTEFVKEKVQHFESIIKILNGQIAKAKQITDAAGEAMENEFYEKKMALGKMLQVITEKRENP